MGGDPNRRPVVFWTKIPAKICYLNIFSTFYRPNILFECKLGIHRIYVLFFYISKYISDINFNYHVLFNI